MSNHPKSNRRLERGHRIIDAAFGQSASQTVLAGARIFGSGRGSALVYRLNDGWAYRAVDWPDGRRAIVEIHLPGDIVGLDAAMLARPVDKVVAVTPLMTQAIDTATLAELMTSPAAAAAVFRLLGKQQQRIERLAATLAQRDAHERLALMLIDLYDRLRHRNLVISSSYDLPLTQQQIGDHLGLTLVHVNRVLHSLREKKIVNLKRRMVTIHDLERLRDLATSGRSAQRLSAFLRNEPSVVIPTRNNKRSDAKSSAISDAR